MFNLTDQTLSCLPTAQLPAIVIEALIISRMDAKYQQLFRKLTRARLMKNKTSCFTNVAALTLPK